MDYHRLDIMSIAWNKLFDEMGELGLSKIARYLNISGEPLPHRAINGAKLALEVYKKLL
jgi:hypothetical protein